MLNGFEQELGFLDRFFDSNCVYKCIFMILMHIDFFFAAKSSKERPPTFLTPEGNASRKEELRGNVLSLECIAEGL